MKYKYSDLKEKEGEGKQRREPADTLFKIQLSYPAADNNDVKSLMPTGIFYACLRL